MIPMHAEEGSDIWERSGKGEARGDRGNKEKL